MHESAYRNIGMVSGVYRRRCSELIEAWEIMCLAQLHVKNTCISSIIVHEHRVTLL